MSLIDRLRRRAPPARVPNESELLQAARGAYPGLAYADMSRETLSSLARREGVDFATALFYDRVRRSPEHGPFIRAVESLEPHLETPPRLQGRVLIAPAALYREFPRYGGDGRLVRQIAGEFGLEAALLPVRSTGTVRENAAAIATALETARDGPLVVVSLSKGGADVRMALQASPAAARKVRAWVQICGLVRGTPEIEALLGRRTPANAATRLFLRCAGVGEQVLRELSSGPGSLLGGPAAAPEGTWLVNVVACPLAAHLRGASRVRHRRLASLGPNDGSTLVKDAILEPGFVYPVWGADHYFRVPEAGLLVSRLFLYLARTGLLPTVAPAPGGAARPGPWAKEGVSVGGVG